MDTKFLPPVFFKASDVPDFKTLKEYEVCKGIFDIVDKEKVLGCQRIRGLWRIYVKTDEDRIKLLANRITLRNQSIGVYKDNPYRAGVDDPEQETVKLTIRDIPLSKGNSGIESFLTEKGIERTSNIQYGKIRDPDTKELSEILSGDRIVYVKPFVNNISRNVSMSGTTASVFYNGQLIPKRPKLCTNCYSTEHFKSQCTDTKKCIKCKEEDHSVSNTPCEATLNKPSTSVSVFQGRNDVLSNFYPCSINVHGILAKSSEHAYQYVKGIRANKLDIANQIKEAPTAFLAKKIARELPYSAQWAEDKVEIMKHILDEKSKQVPEFATELLATKANKLAEAVQGEMFWASGLNKEETLNTKRSFWPGENHMGDLLRDLREQLVNATNVNSSGQKKKL